LSLFPRRTFFFLFSVPIDDVSCFFFLLFSSVRCSHDGLYFPPETSLWPSVVFARVRPVLCRPFSPFPSGFRASFHSLFFWSRARLSLCLLLSRPIDRAPGPWHRSSLFLFRFLNSSSTPPLFTWSRRFFFNPGFHCFNSAVLLPDGLSSAVDDIVADLLAFLICFSFPAVGVSRRAWTTPVRVWCVLPSPVLFTVKRF